MEEFHGVNLLSDVVECPRLPRTDIENTTKGGKRRATFAA